MRRPEQLRLHPAFADCEGIALVGEFNDSIRLKSASLHETVLITPDGIILAGFGCWRLALFDGTPEIHCIEYPIAGDDALEFILAHHRTRRGWNRMSTPWLVREG